MKRANAVFSGTGATFGGIAHVHPNSEVIHSGNEWSHSDVTIRRRTQPFYSYFVSIIRDWSLITGRGGYKTGGGHVKGGGRKLF